MSLSAPEINMRIKRQRLLLQERQAEYGIFGATEEDVLKDEEIIEEIEQLERSLAELES